MASTYTPIATYTVSSATNPINFTSIPQTYTDLVLVCNARETTAATNDIIWARINNDASAIYSNTELFGDGLSAQSGRGTGQSLIYASYTAAANAPSGTFGTTIMNFQNYADTNVYKTILIRGSAAYYTSGSNHQVSAVVCSYRSFDAISTISVWTNSGSNWDVGSTFTLYGIKAA